MKNASQLVADELRAIRAKKDMTIEEVASKTGISKETICRYENNLCSLKVDKIEKMLNAYEVDFDIFFKNVFA